MEQDQNQKEPKPTESKTAKRKPIILRYFAIYYCIIMFLLFISIFRPNTILQLNKSLTEVRNSADISLFTTIPLAVMSIVMIVLFLLRSINKNKNNFIEIDEEKTKRNQKIFISLTNNACKLNDEDKKDISMYKDFYSYFYMIIDYIDNQIEASDKKASLLLHSGKYCIIIGFFFYAGVIILWQLFVDGNEFKFKYIYGMISSSLLFIFIEFFGAWFLRQYKHFVDTSTYLIKIKSILQRYILSYLALKDAKEKKFDTSPVVSLLQEEIKWPETYLLKSPDVNFAKECVETATNLIKSLPIKNKNNNGE